MSEKNYLNGRIRQLKDYIEELENRLAELTANKPCDHPLKLIKEERIEKKLYHCDTCNKNFNYVSKLKPKL